MPRSTRTRSPRTSARLAALAAVALAVPVATGTAVADPGNGKAKGHEQAPAAQPAPAAAPAAQPAPARAPQGKAKGHAKPTPPRGRSHSAPAAAQAPAKTQSAQSAPPAPATSHGQSKETICHATGSATNPYVAITIAAPAVRAHARHQDGRDIIPAPAGGCPGGAAKPQAEKTHAPKGHGHSKVTICHATGSATNPYVEITIAEPAVRAHARHQDGRDIIPAPAAGCPGAPAAAASSGTTATGTTPTATTIASRAFAAPVATVLAALGIKPAVTRSPVTGAVLGETDTAPAAAAEGPAPVTGAVLGETDTAPAAAVAPALATRENGASPSSLPFTGLTLWLVVVAGLAALLGGVTIRRAARR